MKDLRQLETYADVIGAGGSIGVGRVARATPDGYTFGIGECRASCVRVRHALQCSPVMLLILCAFAVSSPFHDPVLHGWRDQQADCSCHQHLPRTVHVAPWAWRLDAAWPTNVGVHR